MNSPAFDLNEPRWMEKQFLFISFQWLASTALSLIFVITKELQVIQEWGEEEQGLLQAHANFSAGFISTSLLMAFAQYEQNKPLRRIIFEGLNQAVIWYIPPFLVATSGLCFHLFSTVIAKFSKTCHFLRFLVTCPHGEADWSSLFNTEPWSTTLVTEIWCLVPPEIPLSLSTRKNPW